MREASVVQPLPTRSVVARAAAVALAAAALVAGACSVEPSGTPSGTPAAAKAAPSPQPQEALPRVLVFSKTAGFRHKSIPEGIAAIKDIGSGRWSIDATEDAGAFTTDNLHRYRAVVFLSTTGNVLDDAQQSALEGFVRAGGGWVGVHAAADTEYDWPWYGKLVGAWFKGHPRIQEATVRVEDRVHRSTRMLPAEWRRTDEWYSFRSDPRNDVHVLAALDERSYDPEKTPMGADHPIAWYHAFDGGRAWYTALGHTAESYADPLFRQHLREGIAWSMDLPDMDSGAAPVPPAAPSKPAARAGAASRILADAPPTLAAAPTSVVLGAVTLAIAIVLGASGHGIKGTLLAWAFPGLGHVALGYRRRGFLAMAGVVGMFVCGLLVGGVDAVDSVEDGPWFIAQSLNGPIAFAADWVDQAFLKTGKVGELLPAPPPLDALGRPQPGQFTVSTYKGLGAANEFGTLFIALGGMMNLVLVMDISRREPAGD